MSSERRTITEYRSNRVLWHWAVMVLAVQVVGCEAQSSSLYNPVGGLVTFEGEAVSGGTVMFHHQDRASGGEIDSQGRYQVYGKGLMAGTYFVSITPPSPFREPPRFPSSGPPRPKLEFSEFPDKYRSPLTSGLQVVVEAGDNFFQFDMLKQPDEKSEAEAGIDGDQGEPLSGSREGGSEPVEAPVIREPGEPDSSKPKEFKDCSES